MTPMPAERCTEVTRPLVDKHMLHRLNLILRKQMLKLEDSQQDQQPLCFKNTKVRVAERRRTGSWRAGKGKGGAENWDVLCTYTHSP